MSQRILRRSAELLDDTDDLTRRMDLQLFHIEHAVDYSDGGWVPGDPLYERPTNGAENNGQYARRLFDLFASVPLTRVAPLPTQADTWQEDFPYRRGRCLDCEVSWHGPENCWVCGKQWELETAEFFLLTREMQWEYTVNLDPWGYILKPLTAKEEKVKYDEQYGPRNIALDGRGRCPCALCRSGGIEPGTARADVDDTSLSGYSRTFTMLNVSEPGEISIQINANVVDADRVVRWLQTLPRSFDLALTWSNSILTIEGMSIGQQRYILRVIDRLERERAQQGERYSFILDAQQADFTELLAWLQTMQGVSVEYDIDYHLYKISGMPRSAYAELQERISRAERLLLGVREPRIRNRFTF